MTVDSVAREMSGKLGELINAGFAFAAAKQQKKDFAVEKAGYERALAAFEAKLATFKAEFYK